MKYLSKVENNLNSLNDLKITISSYLQRAEYLKEKIFCFDCYDRGVLLINEAILEDNLKNYQRAYQLYSDGIELILKYTQFEKNSTHSQIHKQLESYLDRAEIMKKMITASSSQSTTTLSTSSSSLEEENQHINYQSSVAPPISICVLCLSAPAVYAMIPCSHLILCEECLNEQSQRLNSCYLCRTQLTPPNYLKIFTT